MAKKYIDAERLKELLDAKYKEFTEKAKKDCPLQYQYMADGLDIAEQFIDSLQQEQPEVDLDKEIEKFFDDCIPTYEVSLYGIKESVIEVGDYEGKRDLLYDLLSFISEDKQ